MATPIQRSIGNLLGEGAHNRIDYAAYTPSSRPRSVQEFDRLRLAAHDAGPGTDEWSSYHHWLQIGMDRDSLPDAEGGGVPRSLADTAMEIQAAQEQQNRHFQRDRINPLLLTHGWQGVSFADLGPAASMQIISEQMASATPSERAIWARVHQAVSDSPYTDMGISFEAPEPVMEWRANSGDDNAQDPSGFSQWFNNRDPEAGALNSLYIRNANNDPALAGVDLSTTGAGGGTWYADLQIAQESGGNFHQGDPSLDVINPL